MQHSFATALWPWEAFKIIFIFCPRNICQGRQDDIGIKTVYLNKNILRLTCKRASNGLFKKNIWRWLTGETASKRPILGSKNIWRWSTSKRATKRPIVVITFEHYQVREHQMVYLRMNIWRWLTGKTGNKTAFLSKNIWRCLTGKISSKQSILLRIFDDDQQVIGQLNGLS